MSCPMLLTKPIVCIITWYYMCCLYKSIEIPWNPYINYINPHKSCFSLVHTPCLSIFPRFLFTVSGSHGSHEAIDASSALRAASVNQPWSLQWPTQANRWKLNTLIIPWDGIEYSMNLWILSIFNIQRYGNIIISHELSHISWMVDP